MSQTVRRYGLWSGIAALWLVFLVVAATLIRTRNFAMADFRVYYQTGVKPTQNLPIYETQVQSDPVYLYPPLLAQILTIPAASLSYDAAWIKVFPALLIIYFIWKREWRVALGAVVGGIALGVLQIAISGSELMLEMFPTLFSLTNEGQSLWVYTNASILGFSMKTFLAHADTAPLVISPTFYTISRIGLSLLVVGGMLYVTAPRRSKNAFDSEYSLVLLTSLLISPTLFPTSMPPVLLCYCLLIRAQPSRRMLGFCTLACIGLSLYGIITLLYAAGQPVSALFAPLGFYILIITWGVNIYLLRKPPTPQLEHVFA